MRYAPGAVINLVSVAKSFDAVMNTGTEHRFCPVEAFAIILDHYDDDEQMVTRAEPVIRVNAQLLTLTECKAAYGDNCIDRYTN
jgi:hypothetical protein